MTNWSGETKELDKLYESFKGHLPEIEKELEPLIKTQDANVVMLYSRRCLEVIITDLCETELKRPRKTEPLKGIIDKLNSEEKVPSYIIASMLGLNSLSTYGAHPKDFDPEQVKPVINNLAIIIKWYLKFKGYQIHSKAKEDTDVFKNKADNSDSSGISMNGAANYSAKSNADLQFRNSGHEKDQEKNSSVGTKGTEYNNNFMTVNIVSQQAPKTMVFIPGKLEIVNGNDAGKQFVLSAYPAPTGAIVSIGSREETGDRKFSHIRLMEKTVSRAQAEFIYRDKKLYIKNLSKTNYTQLDGTDLQPEELGEVVPGSKIRMGELVFQYHL
jgi:hypothetical protein